MTPPPPPNKPDELCPFCGHESNQWAYCGEKLFVQCVNKECPIFAIKFWSKDWNTRHEPEKVGQNVYNQAIDDAAQECVGLYLNPEHNEVAEDCKRAILELRKLSTPQPTDNMNKTTILPDGSAFSTGIVMSEEEAMKFPVKERPICFRISSEMYHAVWEAIGAASMTFNAAVGNEVFNTEQASKIATDLCFKIAEEVELKIKLNRDDAAKNALMESLNMASDVIGIESSKYAQPDQKTPAEMTLSGLQYKVTSAILKEADKLEYLPKPQ